MTPERELLMDVALREILDDSLDAEDLARLKRARDHAADVLADVEAAPKTGPLKRGLNDNESILAWAVDYLNDVILSMQSVNRALAQPESPQQAVPAGCVECMQEASEVLSEERMPRGPLADELWGFSLMLRDNAAQATQQAVLDAYTCCAEIAREWEDDYVNEDTAPCHVDVRILAARDALERKS